jgi:hypothetical protein
MFQTLQCCDSCNVWVSPLLLLNQHAGVFSLFACFNEEPFCTLLHCFTDYILTLPVLLCSSSKECPNCPHSSVRHFCWWNKVSSAFFAFSIIERVGERSHIPRVFIQDVLANVSFFIICLILIRISRHQFKHTDMAIVVKELWYCSKTKFWRA